jgi:hypothetical protein
MEAFFPRAMQIILPGGNALQFKAGINSVPDELADHWWFAANGVTPRSSSVRPT